MQQIKNIVLIGISYVLLCTIVPLFMIPVVVLMLLPESKRFDSKPLFFFLDLFYRVTIRFLLVPITIKGSKNIPKSPAIIVANHQSILDIPLVGMLLKGYPQMWFSLTSYAQIPVLGFFLRRLGVPLDTTNAGSSASGLLRAIRLVNEYERHTIIFPEGGRYIDGEIHEFLKGFALIAKITRRPVVPFFLINPGKVLPPRSFCLHRVPLGVIVGEPFFYTDSDTEESFVAKVRAWFLEVNKQH